MTSPSPSLTASLPPPIQRCALYLDIFLSFLKSIARCSSYRGCPSSPLVMVMAATAARSGGDDRCHFERIKTPLLLQPLYHKLKKQFFTLAINSTPLVFSARTCATFHSFISSPAARTIYLPTIQFHWAIVFSVICISIWILLSTNAGRNATTFSTLTVCTFWKKDIQTSVHWFQVIVALLD